jgi:hypothetical protein
MEVKGTCANCPSDAYLFDYVNCDNCAVENCSRRDEVTGCRFGVEVKNNG